MFTVTMTRNLCLGAIACGVLTVGSLSNAPEAQALVLMESSSLNTNNDVDADANWFDISFQKNLDDTVTFNFANLAFDEDGVEISDNSTKISTIYFGTDDGFFNWFEEGVVDVETTSGSADYSIDWTPSGNSGRQITNNAGWNIAISGDPEKRNDSGIINPGDVLSITFNLMNPAVTEEEIALAFTSDPKELGIAYHVQAIAGEYSEWYEAQPKFRSPTPVPTPAAVTPTLVGLLTAARKRKRDIQGNESVK